MSLPPPPPEATYIFRGHAAQIHSTLFIRRNTRLVTGDADGWVVIWALATRRPTAVWRAHEAAILGLTEWGSDRLITHGKDNKLLVWKLAEEDEESLDVALPVEAPTLHRKQPWLLYVLDVNTLNFCSFGHCIAQHLPRPLPTETSPSASHHELLIAVPNTLSSEAVDIFHLPSQVRLTTVRGDKSTNTGMVMAVSILYVSSHLTLVVGYESGHTMVVQDLPNIGWSILYLSKPHSQPVLSLDITPVQSFYITSGADGIIAKHPLSSLSPSLSTPPLQPLPRIPASKFTTKNGSLLSIAFAKSSFTPPVAASKPPPQPEVATEPLKTIQTKHSGQQSLRIRSDGRIFATAGWDSKIRVYGVSTLKQLAVLKWHKEGCYAVAFAEVVNAEENNESTKGAGSRKEDGKNGPEIEGLEGSETSVVTQAAHFSLAISPKERRIQQATQTHWIAAGSKDGKVSLWEIY